MRKIMTEVTPLSPQQVFDICARHLLTQAQRSLSEEGGGCAYRGTRGLKCAIGPFIADSMYKPSMEGSLSSLWNHDRAVLQTGGLCQDTINLAIDLQTIHDACGDPIFDNSVGGDTVDDWPHLLRNLARLNGLSSSVVDRAEEDFRARREELKGDKK